MKNKLYCILLLCLILLTSSCGRINSDHTDNSSDILSAQIATQLNETTDLRGGDIMIPDIHMEAKFVPDNEAIRFVRNMKIGWNLGNTFDAYSDGDYLDNEMNLETSWCGAKTTKELILSIKEAGFNTIRIPVSWHNHVTDDDFTISKQWLDRVQEVVDFAIDADLYVIINTHHDVAYNYYYPANEYMDISSKYIQSIWTQIADRFSGYDNHLIFESLNEPRLKDTGYEWWLDMNNTDCVEAVSCINQLNQLFVDTVRNMGGNNAERYLMVPAYCASSDFAAHESFLLPTDSAQNRLIVSVHAYKPYHFALQGPEEEGSVSQFNLSDSQSTGEIDEALDNVYNQFVINGIPVVIGEFGARDKDGNLQDRVDLATYYIAAASARGITCCWWDNHYFHGTGENFGLIDRLTNTWKYPDIVNGLMKYTMDTSH